MAEVSNFPVNSLVFHIFPYFLVLPLTTMFVGGGEKIPFLAGKLETSAEERGPWWHHVTRFYSYLLDEVRICWRRCPREHFTVF